VSRRDPKEDAGRRQEAANDESELLQRLVALEDAARVRDSCETLCVDLWEQIAVRRRASASGAGEGRSGDARVAQALPRVRLAGAASEAELRRLLHEGGQVKRSRIGAVADALGAALTSLLTRSGRMLYRLDEGVAVVDGLDWRTLQGGRLQLDPAFLSDKRTSEGIFDDVETPVPWEPSWDAAGDALLPELRRRYGDPVAKYACLLAADAARFPDATRPGCTRLVTWMPRSGRAGACAFASALVPSRPGADALEAEYPGLVPNTVAVLETGQLTGAVSMIRALLDAAGEWTARLPDFTDGELRQLAAPGAHVGDVDDDAMVS